MSNHRHGFRGARPTRLAWYLACLLWLGCGGGSASTRADAATGTGGPATGGTSYLAGSTGMGGAQASGGATASGGTSAGASGGATGKGGVTGVGGTAQGGTGVGGVTGSGGGTITTPPGTGGVAVGTGGMAGTGGTATVASRAGGATGSGGLGGGGTRVGGATGTGGAGSGGASGTPGRDAGPDVARADASSPNTGTDATYPIAAGKPTVYLAGDSTVQTYSASQAPQQGWGQRIAELFTSDVVFVNKAIGGRSSKSFIDEGRLTEIAGLLKAGDYLFAQWGINDRYQSDPARYTNPASTFRDYLKQYIDAARGKNAIPVLVTPTPRLDYTNGAFQNGFADYCTAIKAVGRETNTPVIDLQTMGLALYTALGYDAVVETISLPGPDVLHFRDTGAYQMARLVARGVRDIDVPISRFVLEAKLAGP